VEQSYNNIIIIVETVQHQLFCGKQTHDACSMKDGGISSGPFKHALLKSSMGMALGTK
jgi:hypothetical protein